MRTIEHLFVMPSLTFRELFSFSTTLSHRQIPNTQRCKEHNTKSIEVLYIEAFATNLSEQYTL